MPREPRIEYAGALYHVLNRGNYRQELFAVHGAGASFEQTLYEACDRFGWQVHAFVLMSNHYHLCVETPDANLGLGLQWLQSTFANRFNRFVHERGHVFQGRYKALLIERGDALLRVVNYIHLNPVRAGIEQVETLERYAMSSFPRFFTIPRRLSCQEAVLRLNSRWGWRYVCMLGGRRCCRVKVIWEMPG